MKVKSVVLDDGDCKKAKTKAKKLYGISSLSALLRRLIKEFLRK